MNFRWKAMQKMREPDELDSPTILATPRGWVAVMVVLVVTVGAVIWVFVGSLPVDVSASGLLTRPGGTAVVQTAATGVVSDVVAVESQHVVAGTRLAVVQTAAGDEETVTSPFAGDVVGISVSAGQVVSLGAPIATIERTSRTRNAMVAMLFVPDQKANGLRPGSTVNLSVSTAPSSRYGLLRGRIASVSKYPLSSGQLAGLVGGSLAARAYTRSGPPRLVVVTLLRDPGTRSGLAWSTKDGPPFTPGTQVAVSGSVTVSSQTPFDLLFGVNS